MAVCGPDTSISNASTNSPGRWHDGHVSQSLSYILQLSALMPAIQLVRDILRYVRI